MGIRPGLLHHLLDTRAHMFEQMHKPTHSIIFSSMAPILAPHRNIRWIILEPKGSNQAQVMSSDTTRVYIILTDDPLFFTGTGVGGV
jgi:hypothetical protein